MVLFDNLVVFFLSYHARSVVSVAICNWALGPFRECFHTTERERKTLWWGDTLFDQSTLKFKLTVVDKTTISIRHFKTWTNLLV